MEPLVNVPILVGEFRAALHTDHQQFRHAMEVDCSLGVVVDSGFVRLPQLQFTEASCEKELLS